MQPQSGRQNSILLVSKCVAILSISLALFGCPPSTLQPKTHEKIGFTRAPAVGGIDNLWIMNDDGSDASLISNLGEKNSLSMTWSPDGKSIAFESTRDNNLEIYTADIVDNGGTYAAQNIRRRTNAPGDDGFPAWSNNCGIIAFSSNRANEEIYSIYQLDLTSDAVTPITNGHEDYSPSWSPDGSMIAFQRIMGGTGEIFVRILTSGQEIRLTNNNLHDSDPSWSPQGRIIFARLNADRTWARLYEMDATDANSDGNGDHLEEILSANANEYNQRPEYSPSGEAIVFFRSQEAGGGGPGDVWKLDIQSRTVQNLTQTNPHHEHGATWKRMKTCLKK
jgi:Tol biopolymer transport system component